MAWRRQLAVAALALAIAVGAAAAAEPTPTGEIDPSLFSPVVVPATPELIYDFRVPAPTPGRAVQAALPTPIVIVPATPKPVRRNPSVADAKAYALSRLGATQFSCLDRLARRESGWRVHAVNSSSGAYGIPQALPGSKMAIIADDWRDNPVTQVRWMIRYVNARYGSACGAWAHSEAVGWY
jgi:hypothetical protein